MKDVTLSIDEAQLRLLWAGAKHYRNVYGGLHKGRNTSKYWAATSCMKILEQEALKRNIDLNSRKG